VRGFLERVVVVLVPAVLVLVDRLAAVFGLAVDFALVDRLAAVFGLAVALALVDRFAVVFAAVVRFAALVLVAINNGSSISDVLLSFLGHGPPDVFRGPMEIPYPLSPTRSWLAHSSHACFTSVRCFTLLLTVLPPSSATVPKHPTRAIEATLQVFRQGELGYFTKKPPLCEIIEQVFQHFLTPTACRSTKVLRRVRFEPPGTEMQTRCTTRASIQYHDSMFMHHSFDKDMACDERADSVPERIASRRL
jgi:hypothetical protein